MSIIVLYYVNSSIFLLYSNIVKTLLELFENVDPETSSSIFILHSHIIEPIL